MTSYNNEGNLVDKKAWNLHMSARPDAAVSVAGASAFTLTTTGDIPAGAILIPGSTAGRVDISLGAADETMLGIATYTRQQGDVRPLTYTVLGYVEMIAGAAGITAGDLLASDATSTHYGCAEPWVADVDGTNAEGLTAMKACFGKALSTAAAGGRFLAYVNFLK